MISAKIDFHGLEISAQNLARSTARCALSDMHRELFDELIKVMDTSSNEFEIVIEALRKVSSQEKEKYKPITGYSVEGQLK